MRIITGDECGLLKEVIPELCRPSNNDVVSASSSSSSAPSATAIHAGRARPSATSIQAAAASYGNQSSSSASKSSSSAVQRLEPQPESIGRDRGVVSLAFLPSNGGGQEFNFAALRMNGIVETWSGNRITSYDDDDEVNVTAASYKKSGGLAKSVILNDEKDEEDGNEDDAVSSSSIGENGEDGAQSNSNSNGNSSPSKGWYTEQPIRPIGMVSTYNPIQSNDNNSSTSNNPILATCDSIGTISILNTNHLSKGVVSTYNAFDNITSSSLPSPSSSKNAIGKGTLTYTKGRFANNNIATSMAICGSGTRLGVGGRERGMRIVDLESGKLIWKVRRERMFV